MALATGDSQPPAPAWIELPDRTTFPLVGDCRIGRIKGNDIVNPDSRVSRQNSVVTRQGNHFVLVDLGSTNGTFLNGVRIYKPTRLNDRDVILVGSESYLFREPADLADGLAESSESLDNRTQVLVGKIFCWMLVVVPPDPTSAPSAAWSEQMRLALVAGGAGVKRLPGASLFAHWRDGRGVQEKVRVLLLEFAAQARPAGSRLAVHHGAVRVGPGANPAEENLLGPDVNFTHQLAKAAARLNAGILLTDAAIRSLSLDAEVRPLGAQQLDDQPAKYPLFAL
jgi:pSer/pThr/pTyr-binding forkhead associated (FHA) protein